jgi:hypothetical protein
VVQCSGVPRRVFWGVQTPPPKFRNFDKVPKIKKILLHEMKFLVPNYSCLQNPWLGGHCPQIPVLSVLNWICWTPPKKIPGYTTGWEFWNSVWSTIWWLQLCTESYEIKINKMRDGWRRVTSVR